MIKRITYLTSSILLLIFPIYSLFKGVEYMNANNAIGRLFLMIGIIHLIVSIIFGLVNTETIQILDFIKSFTFKRLKFKGINNIYITYTDNYTKVNVYEQKYLYAKKIFTKDFTNIKSLMTQLEAELNDIFKQRLKKQAAKEYRKKELTQWNRNVDFKNKQTSAF